MMHIPLTFRAFFFLSFLNLLMACGSSDRKRGEEAQSEAAPPEYQQGGNSVFNKTPSAGSGSPAAMPLTPDALPMAPAAAPQGVPAVQSPLGLGPVGSNLFVVIGGKGSCVGNPYSDVFPGLIDARIFHSFINSIILTQMASSIDQVIFACYDFMTPQMQFYEVQGERKMISLREGDLDSVVINRGQLARKIVIIGHSWGGWRAMKLASSPHLLNNIRTPMILVTLDPISKVMCHLALEAACREAPADLSSSELAQLNSRLRWMNAYQEKGLLLGSGPMQAAHYNIKVDANHLQIHSDPGIWNTVSAFVGSFVANPY